MKQAGQAHEGRAQGGQSQGGFSLIEMLVSLSVTALVATVLMIGIGRMDVRARLTGAKDAQLDEIAAAQFTLRHRIAQITPAMNPQTGNTIDFAGTEFGVEFAGEPPDNAAPNALQRYRLRLDQGGNLMLYRLNTISETIDPRAPSIEGWTATRLLAGAGAMAVRYYGPLPQISANAQAGSGWQTNWSNRAALPSLIGIRLDFAAGDTRGWPDLVVRLRAANGDNCERDLRTDDCKGSV